MIIAYCYCLLLLLSVIAIAYWYCLLLLPNAIAYCYCLGLLLLPIAIAYCLICLLILPLVFRAPLHPGSQKPMIFLVSLHFGFRQLRFSVHFCWFYIESYKKLNFVVLLASSHVSSKDHQCFYISAILLRIPQKTYCFCLGLLLLPIAIA